MFAVLVIFQAINLFYVEKSIHFQITESVFVNGKYGLDPTSY